MKNFIKLIAAMMCAAVVTAAAGISVCAAELFSPYGYSLPLETLASDPYSLNDQNYISGINGTASYDDVNGFSFVPSSDSAMFLILGGKNYAGTDFTEAQSAGRLNTKIIFSLKKSDNPNQSVNPIEYLDFSNYLTLDGKDKSVGFKYYYSWDTYYQVNLNGLNQSVLSGNIYFGKFYIYTCEINVPDGTVYQCIRDYETEEIIAQLTTSGNISAARNGAMARFFSMWDVGIKEFSCYRETFLVKNEKIATDEDTITAQFDVALDCSENMVYGRLDTKSPVLVLCQYDKNNRLLSYDIQKTALKPKALNATDNTFATITASVEKSRYYDHAAAYIWNNEDDMFAYREPLTIK